MRVLYVTSSLQILKLLVKYTSILPRFISDFLPHPTTSSGRSFLIRSTFGKIPPRPKCRLHIEHASLRSSWPTNDRVRPTKQILRLSNRRTSLMARHSHPWIQMFAMILLTSRCGSRRSQTSRVGKGYTVPLPVVSVPGELFSKILAGRRR